MPSSQRPFFLSSFLAAFRQQPGPSASSLSAAASSQPNKSHSHQSPSTSTTATSGARTISTSASTSLPSSQTTTAVAQRTTTATTGAGSVMNQLPLHSPGRAVPIPGSPPGRRRGSDSSSEGFRDVLGAEKWYIGGRTAGGEEKFFKLGVVKRVRSNDRLSLDRLSL
ncbi:uncharacterized protein BCR38DRAFT_77136 [Pseudomassariella vexata]|uniref:Uncharacterized protein n=1 Tax=Pseudomassariella vexata TaxID=1141098 RepID=A0A1Y2DFR8_9PEZI|nr:uncharacterized protein BCR38DRAFT_77136 [Pseudomassariella vexata]ORY58132.1 hypothetical protein BCR38DRAFT_77136 [Pseudomassariella vexata]